MSKVPAGYLDMSHADYVTFDIGVLRTIYAKMRDIVCYTMGNDCADAAIKAYRPTTPVEWLMAIKQVTCKCTRCKGSGTYYWGVSVNGKMSHSAPCARCGGNGQMTFDDMRRGRAYDGYAIARAAR